MQFHFICTRSLDVETICFPLPFFARGNLHSLFLSDPLVKVPRESSWGCAEDVCCDGIQFILGIRKKVSGCSNDVSAISLFPYSG